LLVLLLVLTATGCSREETPARDDSPAVAEDAMRALSPVRFYREYVKVEPSRRLTKVSALYYFRNESDRRVKQGISYPFPVDRFHLYPRSIRVWEKNGDDLRAMGFLHRERNVLWTMDLEAGEEIVIRVDYTQEIRRPRAVYIVTTTKNWKRPIEVAEFEFRVPAELDSVELSFEPDRRATEGDTTVYYVGYTDFMPDEDLVVTWKE
jgi:hypothetical protein